MDQEVEAPQRTLLDETQEWLERETNRKAEREWQSATLSWIWVIPVVGVLGVLAPWWMPNGLPKQKDWLDVVALLVSAFSAMATAAAAIVALYIAWNQRRDQEVQAQKLMLEAGMQLQQRIERCIEACDSKDVLSLEVRGRALEQVDRRLQTVRGELFMAADHIIALLHLRDVSDHSVGLVRLALDEKALPLGELRARLITLRREAYKARWSSFGKGFQGPPLEPLPDEQGQGAR